MKEKKEVKSKSIQFHLYNFLHFPGIGGGGIVGRKTLVCFRFKFILDFFIFLFSFFFGLLFDSYLLWEIENNFHSDKENEKTV